MKGGITCCDAPFLIDQKFSVYLVVPLPGVGWPWFGCGCWAFFVVLVFFFKILWEDFWHCAQLPSLAASHLSAAPATPARPMANIATSSIAIAIFRISEPPVLPTDNQSSHLWKKRDCSPVGFTTFSARSNSIDRRQQPAVTFKVPIGSLLRAMPPLFLFINSQHYSPH